MKRANKRLQHIIDQAISTSFKNGKIDKEKIHHFVKYFKSVPSRTLAIELLQLYLDMLKLKLNEGSLRIESAVALTPSQKREIEDFINKRHIVYNTEVKVNSELIGGMRLQIGDQVYENTTAQKINQIGEIIHG